jgi:predicted CopG family antitoxin
MNVLAVVVTMASKTVVLRDEAYDFLLKQKLPGETFSDVVLRLRGAARPITDFAGAWKDMPSEDLQEVREAIRKSRELSRKKAERLAKKMEELP